MMILKHATLLVLVSAFIIGCSSNSENVYNPNTDVGANSKTTPFSIGPEDATKASIISIIKRDTSTGTAEIHWLVNGIRDETSEGHRFIPKELSKGDIVQAVVTSGNDEFLSNELIIKNSPPSIERAQLVPEFPTAESSFQVQVNARDIDNDSVFYLYKWFLNEEYAGDESFLETELKRGDIVSVEVAPSDGQDTGKSVKLNRKILNALPHVADGTPVLNGQTYTYQPIVTDPDGDTLTFTLKKGPEGMSIDQSGILTWEIKPDNSSDHDIEVLINDNHGGEILLPISASISFN